MFGITLLLCFALLQPAYGLIAPMEKCNSEKIDINTVANNLILLDQMLSVTKTERDDMKAKIYSLQANSDTLKSEIATVKSENARMELELALVKASLKASVYSSLSCTRPEVSFEVIETSGTRSVSVDSKLVLNNVTNNAGGGYQSGSGIFKAPEGGTYLFWAHIMTGDVKRFAVDLMKDEVRVSRGFTPAGTAYSTASITTIVDVEKNDNLWFKVVVGSSIHGHYQSSYGGILLFKRKSS